MDPQLEPITETEERLFCTEVMKRLDIQRKNEQFCDVILEVGSGDDQARLKAHSNVLCAGSAFFHNALNSDMKEKKEGVIRLEQTSKMMMQLVLDYLYSGRVEITEENSYELFAQADYFLLPGLKTLSGQLILQTLDISNCISTYNFAIKYQSEQLQKAARDFILANFVAAAGTEDFLNLSGKEVEEWISSDEIIVKEEDEVFEVIVKWMENSRNREDLDFFQLIRHVRCIYVSRSYVFSVILKHPLVKASTACSELVVDAMEEVANGTDECFLNQPPRNCLKTHEDVIVACKEDMTMCYLPSKNKWYELATMSSDGCPGDCDEYCYGISAVHNKLFVIGGHSLSKSYSNAECYDPLYNLWTPIKAPEIVKKDTMAVVTHQGYLYVVGGYNEDDEVISTVERYNPHTKRWQKVASLSCPRSGVCAVTYGNYLYAVGGSKDTQVTERMDIVERFDPRSNAWNKLPSTHANRAYASGVAVRGKVFVFGGIGEESTAANPSCEMYDLAANMWTAIATTVSLKHGASVASFKGQIYVFSYFQHGQDEEKLALQVYDIEKNEWKDIELPVRDWFEISTLRLSTDILAQSSIVS